MGRERGSPDRREQVEIESLGSEMIQPPVIMHQNWLTCGPFRGKRPSSGTGNGFASEVWSKNRAKKTTCRDRASHHRQNDGGLHRKYPVRMYEPPASHHRQNDGGLRQCLRGHWKTFLHLPQRAAESASEKTGKQFWPLRSIDHGRQPVWWRRLPSRRAVSRNRRVNGPGVSTDTLAHR